MKTILPIFFFENESSPEPKTRKIFLEENTGGIERFRRNSGDHFFFCWFFLRQFRQLFQEEIAFESRHFGSFRLCGIDRTASLLPLQDGRAGRKRIGRSFLRWKIFVLLLRLQIVGHERWKRKRRPPEWVTVCASGGRTTGKRMLAAHVHEDDGSRTETSATFCKFDWIKR